MGNRHARYIMRVSATNQEMLQFLENNNIVLIHSIERDMNAELSSIHSANITFDIDIEVLEALTKTKYSPQEKLLFKAKRRLLSGERMSTSIHTYNVLVSSKELDKQINPIALCVPTYTLKEFADVFRKLNERKLYKKRDLFL